MATLLTELEKRVISAIQGDIPITERPYRDLADGIGISESTLLEVLQGLRDKDIIRRFGATLKHQKSGFSANAMVAWIVAEDRIEDVGALMAGVDAVSHCYRRNPTAEWPYNLYTMVHAGSEADCRRIAADMAAAAQIDTYQLLFSRRELKKTSMAYFDNDED